MSIVPAQFIVVFTYGYYCMVFDTDFRVKSNRNQGSIKPITGQDAVFEQISITVNDWLVFLVRRFSRPV